MATIKTKQPLRPGQVIEIEWNDAWTSHEQTGVLEDFHKLNVKCVLRDVGFYLGKKDGYIIIAQDQGPGDEDYRHYHYIPLVNVRKVEVLKNTRVIDAEKD